MPSPIVPQEEVNETTPLVRSRSSAVFTHKPSSTSEASVEGLEPPYPYQQLLVLSLCRICEPIAFMSVFPYIYFMIKSFGVEDENVISAYAGWITSTFAACECFAALFWGSVSDRRGRKSVMMIGMAGTGVSMLLLGFSTNLWMVLLARALGGLLNGNIGVIQATVGEMVKHDGHKASAFAVVPFVWAMGSIFGAFIGGTFADPAATWPGWFSSRSLFAKFPYLLPNVICFIFVIFSLTVSTLFLQETHPTLKNRRDRGLEVGQKLSSCFLHSKTVSWEQEESLIPSDPMNELEAQDAQAGRGNESELKRADTIFQLLTSPILTLIVAHGLLAFHTIALEQLLPVMFATPVSHSRPSSSFLKFVGGLGLNSKEIGTIFAIQGFIQMFAQLLLFPIMSRIFGHVPLFRTMSFLYPVYYFAIPFVILAPVSIQFFIIGLIILYKVLGQTLTYPSLTYLISEFSPKGDLGRVMSIYASVASLGRAIGPSVIGRLHTIGSDHGYSGMSWWILATIALAAGAQSLLITVPPTKKISATLL